MGFTTLVFRCSGWQQAGKQTSPDMHGANFGGWGAADACNVLGWDHQRARVVMV